jgi:hypothetical protein
MADAGGEMSCGHEKPLGFAEGRRGAVRVGYFLAGTSSNTRAQRRTQPVIRRTILAACGSASLKAAAKTLAMPSLSLPVRKWKATKPPLVSLSSSGVVGRRSVASPSASDFAALAALAGFSTFGGAARWGAGCSVAGAGVAFFAFGAFGSGAVVVFEVWSLVASVVFWVLLLSRAGVWLIRSERESRYGGAVRVSKGSQSNPWTRSNRRGTAPGPALARFPLFGKAVSSRNKHSFVPWQRCGNSYES